MVGLQGCFDEAGADFGFGRGVLSVHHLYHTRIPEDKTISANLVYIYITWPFYSLFVHSLSLSVCLSVLVPPVTRPFQTCVPPASCLPDTPDSINEQTPPGRAFLNILFTPRLFLFISLYPCLSSSPFFGVFLLRRTIRAHHRCSLDPLLPSPRLLCHPFPSFLDCLSERIFLGAPCFYRPDSLSMRSTIRFYLLDLLHSRMFYP